LLIPLLVAWPAFALGQDVPPFNRTAPPGDPPPVPGAETPPAGKEPEILGRGPIHQGFAQPSNVAPRPSPVVPKAPPAPIEEVPPEQRPEGDNVIWVPGYWSWDADRSDFIWVSGFWRVAPAGRKWVPGYWTKTDGGWQFVSGYWGEIAQPTPPLVETPPESLDAGPTYPAPDDGSSWVPGCWLNRADRWLWRPGYWCAPRPGWVYNPACYSWTPGGCAYVPGFWDRCLLTRGLPFAPVYFPPGLCATPGFRYTPSFPLGIGGVLGSFWARPGWGHYAFGDFYGARYARAGYQPWHTYGPRFRDPLFNYYRHAYARAGHADWAGRLAAAHDGRVKGTLTPPPRSFTARQLTAGRVTTAGLVQPLSGYRNSALPLVRATAADRALGNRSIRAYGPSLLDRPGGGAGQIPGGARPGAITTRPRDLPLTRPQTLGATAPAGRPNPGTITTRPPAQPNLGTPRMPPQGAGWPRELPRASGSLPRSTTVPRFTAPSAPRLTAPSMPRFSTPQPRPRFSAAPSASRFRGSSGAPRGGMGGGRPGRGR
jgi:hypothetical protein